MMGGEDPIREGYLKKGGIHTLWELLYINVVFHTVLIIQTIFLFKFMKKGCVRKFRIIFVLAIFSLGSYFHSVLRLNLVLLEN